MSALRNPRPSEMGVLYLAPTVEPEDPGYSWWPSWAAPVEELGYLISEYGWGEFIFGLACMFLLVALGVEVMSL